MPKSNEIYTTFPVTITKRRARLLIKAMLLQKSLVHHTIKNKDDPEEVLAAAGSVMLGFCIDRIRLDPVDTSMVPPDIPAVRTFLGLSATPPPTQKPKFPARPKGMPISKVEWEFLMELLTIRDVARERARKLHHSLSDAPSYYSYWGPYKDKSATPGRKKPNKVIPIDFTEAEISAVRRLLAAKPRGKGGKQNPVLDALADKLDRNVPVTQI